MTRSRVVVVGGGLAGTSAALRLSDAGWSVVLLERRPRLGGALYTFARNGLPVDTGQHVLLRCYHEHRALLRRLGAGYLSAMQPRMDIPVLWPGRPTLRLRRARHAPAPLHLAPALLGFRALSWQQRWTLARTVTALGTVDPADPAADAQPLGAWLRDHGGDDEAIARFWAVLVVAALNIDVEDASLALAAQVFRTALLGAADSADIGILSVPQSVVYDGTARAHLVGQGVEVHTGERVDAVDVTGDGFTVRTGAGEIDSDAVVLAVPHRHAADLVPERACPERARWAGLGASPIVNVHVRYDRPVTDLRFGAAIDSPVQWVFDKTEVARCDGQYLTVSLSAADTVADQPAAEILATQLAGLQELFPRAAQAEVLDAFVTREPHATFRQQAGSAALRPAARTDVPGLVLAGAWTATGWPDTTEGAVRSGLAAADALSHPPARSTATTSTDPTDWSVASR
ncbi:MAG: hydroxysqualene dehydroxylase HpnE [Nocardioidaceae bacterium]